MSLGHILSDVASREKRVIVYAPGDSAPAPSKHRPRSTASWR